jgi:hypothetical protein
MIDGRVFYFTSAAIIKQLLEVECNSAKGIEGKEGRM